MRRGGGEGGVRGIATVVQSTDHYYGTEYLRTVHGYSTSRWRDVQAGCWRYLPVYDPMREYLLILG